MTREQAIAEQERIKQNGFSLGWYFGTKCEKCCDVFPRFCHRDANDKYKTAYYKCDVCGKQTDYYGMPWQAEEAWNNHKFLGEGVQLSFI